MATFISKGWKCVKLNRVQKGVSKTVVSAYIFCRDTSFCVLLRLDWVSLIQGGAAFYCVTVWQLCLLLSAAKAFPRLKILASIGSTKNSFLPKERNLKVIFNFATSKNTVFLTLFRCRPGPPTWPELYLVFLYVLNTSSWICSLHLLYFSFAHKCDIIPHV